MCGSALVYGNYKSAIDIYEGGAHIRTVPGYSTTATAGIFCTYPAEFMTKTGQFFSEFLASAVLMFMIFALKDDGNLGAGKLAPLALFFVIFGIGASFGWETGYAINLARDFGPRLASYMLGYGHEVWAAGNYYFWVCSPSTYFLSLLGTLSYAECFIGPHGRPIPRLRIRRVDLRCLLVYWTRQSCQHALVGY
jgi:aquaglyceroporin related protein